MCVFCAGCDLLANLLVVIVVVLVLSYPHVLDVCFCMFLILNYVVRPLTCINTCIYVCVWTTQVVVFGG